MLVVVRGQCIEMLFLTSLVVIVGWCALIWFDPEETFGPLAVIACALFTIMASPAAIFGFLTLQSDILKRSLSRFDFFNLWNNTLMGVWHSISYQGALWVKVMV